MTHEYTVLTGGLILPGVAVPEATAIAWAGDVILALGGDAEVQAISRGDSHVVELGGATVIPLPPGAEPAWPTAAMLEVGGQADLAVLSRDPRLAPLDRLEVLAVIRAGRLVSGYLA
jgi:predicted amidohydrolase YtcJ